MFSKIVGLFKKKSSSKVNVADSTSDVKEVRSPTLSYQEMLEGLRSAQFNSSSAADLNLLKMSTGFPSESLWSALPKEIVLLILAHVDFRSLPSCRLVCKQYRRLVAQVRVNMVLPPACTDERVHILLLMFPQVASIIFPAGPLQLTKMAFQHIMEARREFTDTNFRLGAMTDYVEVNKYGLFLHEAKHYRPAIAFFTRGIELAPHVGTMWYNRASAFYNCDDSNRAMQDYTKVLEIAPDHVSARNGKALILYAKGQFLEAFDGFTYCAEHSGDNSVFWHNRGSVLFQLARYDEAYEDLNRALQLRPDDPNALVSRGTTQFNRGCKQEALEDYNRSLELDKNNAIALNSRGRTLFELQRYDEALNDFDLVLRLDPTNLTATHRRARVLETFGREMEAMAAYHRSLDLEPRDPRDWNARGQSLQRLGRDFEALGAFQRALEMQPNYGDCLHNRARSLLNLGRLHEAMEDVSKALQLEPNNASSYAPTRVAILDAIEKRNNKNAPSLASPPGSPSVEQVRRPKKKSSKPKELTPQSTPSQDCVA